MPTENNGSTAETTDQDQQGQQQQTTDETSGNGEQQQASNAQQEQTPVTLPDDHPLVKSLAALKGTVATQKTELAEARAKSAAVTKLEEELNKRPTQEAVDTLQARYDRLEEFLSEVGGPLSKALDSRTFTRDLFETDKDIADLVKEWHRANPSATTTALGSAAAAPASKKADPNALIRAAAGK